jgi:hypothetical protein
MGISRVKCVSLFLLSLFILVLAAGCRSGGDDDSNPKPEDIEGAAVLGIYLADSGYTAVPPTPEEGYSLVNMDLNGDTGGHYIWLYYRVGAADGSEGMPLSSIYTVMPGQGETSHGGTMLDVNLNAGAAMNEVGCEELYLWYKRSDWPVVRCIVVYNLSSGVTLYAPPEGEDMYNSGAIDIVWVHEQSADDRQDLNEGEGFYSDYTYIGYGVD